MTSESESLSGVLKRVLDGRVHFTQVDKPFERQPLGTFSEYKGSSCLWLMRSVMDGFCLRLNHSRLQLWRTMAKQK